MNTFLRCYITLWGVLSFTTLGLAQKSQQATDTLYHNEDAALKKQTEFYAKWQTKAAKHKWSKNLYNLLFSAPTPITPKYDKRLSTGGLYGSYEGKRIDSISFEIVKPFGQYEKEMPTEKTDNIFDKFGNSIHMKTKEKHLKRMLTIHPHSMLDVKLLEDNEEMLRNLSYVDELFVQVFPTEDDGIRIKFIIKEKFSWSMSYQAHSLDAHKFKLYNKNLWGRGHFLKAGYYYHPDKRVVNNYELLYSVPSIYNTRISVKGLLEHTNENDKYALELERGFIDYKTKLAGGLVFSYVRNARKIPANAIPEFENNIDYNICDIWLGKSITYDLDKNKKYARYRKAITARFARINYMRSPKATVDENPFLLDTRGGIIGFNVSQRQLYRSNLFYNYGRIENIPYGHVAQIFSGIVFNPYQKKGYLGFNFEKAFYSSSRDCYFALQLSGGSFFNKHRMLDGVIHAEAEYISRLYKWREFQHRHFLRARCVVGLNTPNDFMNINGSNGLTNMRTAFANGNRKAVVNIEDVFFTPYTIAGFRTVLYSFADLGFINSNNPTYKSNKVYSSLGLGLRFHNNNFIFSTFQVNFSIFINPPKDMNVFRPDASSVDKSNFRDLQIGKPRFYFEKDYK